MTTRPELLEASDETIEDAVTYADPMVLRGLVYQLTGDESIAATTVTSRQSGFLEIRSLESNEDVALIQAKAAELLKAYRDHGAQELPIGPEDRLQSSLSLVAGEDIPDRDYELWLEQLALHPWTRSLEWPQKPTPEKLNDFSVAVIGAGMGGLNAAVQLKHAGIPYTVFEKNAGVGGTWYENRYPGARVDTPSRGYTHVYGVDFLYPNPFCPQSENEKYFNWIADNFDVRGDIEFNTEVKSVTWDEDAKVWEIEAVSPTGPWVRRFNAVMTAVGFLSRPNVPDLEGAEDFKGEMFHTARWPSDLDLTDKRVAVIGSGCTSYQMIPELAKSVAHTYLFQRTPSWCFDIPGYLDPFPPQVNWLDRNLPYHTNFMRFRAGWLFGPEVLGKGFDADLVNNQKIREQRIDFMKRKFASEPELLEKMLPEAPPMSSRPVLVDEEYSIYDVLMRDDSTLVTEGIARFSENGVVTSDGKEYEVDVIVLATGFKANDYLWPMDIRGRKGERIEELWAKDGARAYLGSMLPGFPNLFMIYGPNTNPTGGLGVAEFEEIETRFALECMAHLILENKGAVDVTSDAYWRYNNELDQAETRKMYSHELVTNYYKNDHGRSACNCPFDGRKMWDWLRDPSGEHAKSGTSINVGSSVRPFFGQDLIVD
jgi:4-hydroxyacetophenone monooxygenase